MNLPLMDRFVVQAMQDRKSHRPILLPVHDLIHSFRWQSANRRREPFELIAKLFGNLGE